MPPLWLASLLVADGVLLLAYAIVWPKRKDISAYIYVHKGAIWFIWLSLWVFFLAYLGAGPMANGLAASLNHPSGLVRLMISLLAVLVMVYLIYLFIVYPFFASLRPAWSREALGLDWQLDVFVEDKVTSLVEDLPVAPLLLLDMGLVETIQETPAEERPTLFKNLWQQYVPVITGRQALGIAFVPNGAVQIDEADLDRAIRLAFETSKITDNHADPGRKYNVLALPLEANGRIVMILAAFWPRRKPFKNVFNLVAHGFCLMRSQFILAAEVPRERLASYGHPWLDGEEGGDLR